MTATYEETQIRLLAYPIDEKLALEQDDLVNSNHTSSEGRCCRSKCTRGSRRNAIIKGALAGLIALLLTIASFLIAATLCPELASLVKRQNNGTSNNNGSSFTNQKLWIIIVVVVGMVPELISLTLGLIIVVALGICVAAWCCQGAFRNPLCCPCYTLACCGCLGIWCLGPWLIIGCLECIGCGLCGEGLSQL
jgi:uncharacterized Tic20 family protein